MEQRHKDIIRHHLVKLTECLMVEGNLIQSLDSDRIFSGHIKDTILCKPTRFGKAAELLDLLPTRGSEAFPAFIKALLISEQEWLAEVLDPILTDQIRATLQVSSAKPQTSSSILQQSVTKDDPLPEKWVDRAHDLLNVQVRKVDPHMQPEMRDLFEESRGHKGMISGNPLIPYKMDTKPRGRVLLIDNSKFLKRAECVILGKAYLDDRENTDLDSTSLDLLFKCLGFTVYKKENLTAQEMLSAVEEEAQIKDHKNASAFIMVLSSHGVENGIYSCDNIEVRIEDLVSPFNARNCKGLAGKPKMIFIQACQGSKDDTVYMYEVSDSGTTSDEQLQEERGQGDKPQKSKSLDGEVVDETYLKELSAMTGDEQLQEEKGQRDEPKKSKSHDDKIEEETCLKELSVMPDDQELQAEKGQHEEPEKSKSDGDEVLEQKYLDEMLAVADNFQGHHLGNLQPHDAADAQTTEIIGTDSDMYIHEATTKGYKSWRNTMKGSWFLQAISWVFQRYAYKEDLLSMMTMVNQLVSRGKVVDERGRVQSVQVADADKNTLKKKVYFFPGLPAHQPENEKGKRSGGLVTIYSRRTIDQ